MGFALPSMQDASTGERNKFTATNEKDFKMAAKCSPARRKLSDSEREVQAVDNFPSLIKDGSRFTFSAAATKDATSFNHGLHKYPAKFIPQIPRWALTLNSTGAKEIVLDPFCGCGTTLVEAGVRGHHAIGVDVSPLATLVSGAKVSVLETSRQSISSMVDRTVQVASGLAGGIKSKLKAETECLGLHFTWSNWFRPSEMARLIALRRSIEQCWGAERPHLSLFMLACLSAVAKGASYLDENQIKVRYVHGKNIKDPFRSFSTLAIDAIGRQKTMSDIYRQADATFEIHLGTAVKLPLKSASVDRVITSPPYINAVDYTMAHKYNLFILGLIAPEEFKDHCRQYIGVTERAVRAQDFDSVPKVGVPSIDQEVAALSEVGTPTSKNRSYVVAQFFSGMRKSFEELHRVVRSGGIFILVIGSSNRICDRTIPTGDFATDLCQRAGFKLEYRFQHVLANRSSMRMNRAATGGQVPCEEVCVFGRP